MLRTYYALVFDNLTDFTPLFSHFYMDAISGKINFYYTGDALFVEFTRSMSDYDCWIFMKLTLRFMHNLKAGKRIIIERVMRV